MDRLTFCPIPVIPLDTVLQKNVLKIGGVQNFSIRKLKKFAEIIYRFLKIVLRSALNKGYKRIEGSRSPDASILDVLKLQNLFVGEVAYSRFSLGLISSDWCLISCHQCQCRCRQMYTLLLWCLTQASGTYCTSAVRMDNCTLSRMAAW